MRSLRCKITIGLSLIAILVVGLALFSYLELRRAQAQIVAGAHVTEFLNVALEIRRFEMNYFLFGQA